ncbi:MAG TPA: PDZ domain-containing protein, partial [Gemmatimonadaceae bacterium]|nr:PDZ domain-containing protein [Gemmatimonadaceae bacterium]
MKRSFGIALVAASVAASAGAQTRVITPRDYAFGNDNSNAARIGVTLGENGIRDTAGVLVSSVVESGPAAKAGIKEGDRIQSIGGVNLKMSRDDADDASLSGMMSRRLTRELDKLKAGDDVELRVLSGGSTKTLHIKTVAARELEYADKQSARPLLQTFRDGNDRAALGLNIGGTVTKRDTLGVFVMSVTPDGPAEKAGIVEGD